MRKLAAGQVAGRGDLGVVREVAISQEIRAAGEGEQGVAPLEANFRRIPGRRLPQLGETGGEAVEQPERNGEEAPGSQPAPAPASQASRAARPGRWWSTPNTAISPKGCWVKYRRGRAALPARARWKAQPGSAQGAGVGQQGGAAVDTEVGPRQEILGRQEGGEAAVAAAHVERAGQGPGRPQVGQQLRQPGQGRWRVAEKGSAPAS